MGVREWLERSGERMCRASRPVTESRFYAKGNRESLKVLGTE